MQEKNAIIFKKMTKKPDSPLFMRVSGIKKNVNIFDIRCYRCSICVVFVKTKREKHLNNLIPFMQSYFFGLI